MEREIQFFERPALLQEELPGKRARCLLCPRGCVVAPGRKGFCRVRKNRDGRLHTLIYGRVSSLSADTIEKKPVFHYQPGSMALSLGSLSCNLRCLHCQNWHIAHVRSLVGSRTFLSPEVMVNLALETQCQGVAWTYNEPTIWLEFALEGATLCKEKGLYTCFVTNGYITPQALDTIGPFLDVFRVDVKGFSDSFYRELARAKDWEAILKAAERARNRWNMHVEIVTNVIPQWNDEEGTLRSIARWVVSSLGKETPWHVTRFVPHLRLSHLPPTPVETLERAREIGLEEGLLYVYSGNVPGHSGEHTYCPSCGAVLIARWGFGVREVFLEEGKCPECGLRPPIRGPAKVTERGLQPLL